MDIVEIVDYSIENEDDFLEELDMMYDEIRDKAQNTCFRDHKNKLSNAVKKIYQLDTERSREIVDYFYYQQGKQELQLLPHQKSHVEKITDKYQNGSLVAMDLSLMGSGKTFCSCKIAQNFDMNVLVICPTSVENKWWAMRAIYGIKIYKVVTYETLRTKTGCQPKYNILNRDDRIEMDKNGNEYQTTEFSPADPFLKVLDKYKTLIIFDEIQKAKNASDTYKACLTLSHAVTRSRDDGKAIKNRILFLSGTPIDKESQCLNMLRLLGIVKHKQMAKKRDSDDKLLLLGARELQAYCKMVNPARTEEINKTVPITPKNYMDNVYRLYIDVVLEDISDKMPPIGIDKKLKIYNYFFKAARDEDTLKLKKLIRAFNSSCFYKKDGILMKKEVSEDPSVLGLIQKMLREIELAKVNIFIDETDKLLRKNKKIKVSLMLNYKDSIKQISEALAEYKPIVITGDVKKELRREMIEPFMRNDNKFRLIIGNFQVLSTGIELDDQHGKFPRYVLASPNYHTMAIQQMTYRFLRAETKSDTIIYFVYVKCTEDNDVKESRILTALASKAKTMREGCLDTRGSLVRYPDEYEEKED